MTSAVEKRSKLRCGASVSVMCGSLCVGSFRNARVVNQSEDGFCIESEFRSLIGTTIFLGTAEETPNLSQLEGNCTTFRTATIAEVKWCREIDFGERRLFRIGMKYYSPEY